MKVKGSRLLLTLKLSTGGTVKVSGAAIAGTTRNLKAGSHQIGLPLTGVGRADARRHRRIAIRATLTVGGRDAVRTASVKG